MPGEDRTGPRGMGPRTGRGMGFCSGYNNPGFGRRAFGRGWGMGKRMWNQFSYPTQNPTAEQEKQMLEEELKQLDQEETALKSEKESLKKRLEELNQ